MRRWADGRQLRVRETGKSLEVKAQYQVTMELMIKHIDASIMTA